MSKLQAPQKKLSDDPGQHSTTFLVVSIIGGIIGLVVLYKFLKWFVPWFIPSIHGAYR